MFEDKSLLERLNHGLCHAVEKKGVICFGKIHRKTYCRKHYNRIKKYKSVNLPDKVKKLCKFIDCNLVHFGKGFCERHYKSMIDKPRRAKIGCTVTECNKFSNEASTICDMHRARLKKYGTLKGSGILPGESTRFKTGHTLNKKPIRTCIVADCDKDSTICEIIKGLCSTHYQRWNRHRDFNIVLKRGKSKNVSHSK